jgi:hypothetical protein
MQLQPILLSMNNLMSGRLFRIPEYQRAYAWGKKQDDIMAAAKLTIVDDDILNETFLHRFLTKARAGAGTIKSALSKVLGLIEAQTTVAKPGGFRQVCRFGLLPPPAFF